MSDLMAFLRARLDEDEARANRRLCIYCGNPTIELHNAIGITGYAHDRWRYDEHGNARTGGWEGVRCPNRLTGAEPVQDPARVLREVAAKRAILDLARIAVGSQWPDLRDLMLRHLAAVYCDHPDYRQEWKP